MTPGDSTGPVPADHGAVGVEDRSRWPHWSVVGLVMSVVVYRFSYTAADPDLWGHVKFGQTVWYTTRERRPASIAVLICAALLPLVATRHTPLSALAIAILAGEHMGAAVDRWSAVPGSRVPRAAAPSGAGSPASPSPGRPS